MILLSSTRIATPSNFILPRGFSFNLVILIWFIASFFLLEVWDKVLLSGQMGETYDGFINTRQDLIESNMTLGQVMPYFMIFCKYLF